MDKENLMNKLKKILKRVLICFVIIYAGIYILAIAISLYGRWADWHDPESNGSYDLGAGIYMIYYGRWKIIVYGIGIRGRTCYGGRQLIPREETMFGDSSGEREWTVDEAVSDEKWIVAELKDCLSDSVQYAILSKEIVAQHDKYDTDPMVESVIYYDNWPEFYDYCKEMGISLVEHFHHE